MFNLHGKKVAWSKRRTLKCRWVGNSNGSSGNGMNGKALKIRRLMKGILLFSRIEY